MVATQTAPVSVSLALTGCITLIVCHLRAHKDELVTASFLKRLNPLAKVVFMAESAVPDSLRNDPTVAFVGMLEGIYDEHKADGRLLGECATTLMAKDVGIWDVSEYQTVWTETLRADTCLDALGNKSYQDAFDLAPQIKLWYENGDKGMKTEHWALDFVDRAVWSLVASESGATPVREAKSFTAPSPKVELVAQVAIPPYASFPTLVKAWLVKRFGYRNFQTTENVRVITIENEEQLAHACKRGGTLFVGFEGGHYPDVLPVREVAKGFSITRKLDELEHNRVKSIVRAAEEFEQNPAAAKPFSLARIVQNLNRHGHHPAASIREDMFRIFEANVSQAVEYHETCPAEWDKLGKKAVIAGLKVGFVESDLYAMASFARVEVGTDVTVIRRKSGHCGIFANNAHAGAIMEIAQEILVAEALQQNWREPPVPLNEADYRDRGRSLPKPAAHWHFAWGMGLNGSHSHPDVPATKMKNQDLRNSLEYALPRYRARIGQ